MITKSSEAGLVTIRFDKKVLVTSDMNSAQLWLRRTLHLPVILFIILQ